MESPLSESRNRSPERPNLEAERIVIHATQRGFDGWRVVIALGMEPQGGDCTDRPYGRWTCFGLIEPRRGSPWTTLGSSSERSGYVRRLNRISTLVPPSATGRTPT